VFLNFYQIKAEEQKERGVKFIQRPPRRTERSLGGWEEKAPCLALWKAFKSKEKAEGGD